jgi:hypothetical protein
LNNTTSTKYEPTGPDPVWLNKNEVSDIIESALRHAANSSELHHHFRQKQKLEDRTIANILDASQNAITNAFDDPKEYDPPINA